ncbi:MAG: hypothetical protein ACYC06_02930 [Ilumatobacteraceae bacterium]
MKQRGWMVPTLVWALLTAVGELAFGSPWYLPETYAREGRISRDAFVLLVRLAVPVFAFVVAMLAVSVARYRSPGRPTADGPPLRGNKRVYIAWIAITSALAMLLIVNPGLVGLAEIRGEGEAQLVVRVEAARFFWTVEYPGHGVTVNDEMVLPVGRRILIELNSKDVLHSLWIPAFAAKIDAVPGRTTMIYITPERTGSLADDPGLRIQCAELCGVGHATMRIPVRVVTPDEFDAWLGASGDKDSATECGEVQSRVELTAEHIAFDRHCLAVPSGQAFTVTFENREAVPHNFSIYADESGTKPLFTGDIFSGPATQELHIPALPEGQAFFRCDLHPIPAMSGILEIGEEGGGE